MVFLKGWIGDPKLVYNVFFWTVNPTDQKNFFASMGYQFTRRFSLYAGLNGLPGTRSLQGSHPYWLGHDRVMADEFFRPYFANGVWAQGEILPGLWYNVMAANNLSALGIKAHATGSQVGLRRVHVVDADDARVRSPRRIRRLGVPREGRDAVRLLHDGKPRRALHGFRHRRARQHAHQAGRQPECVRHRRAGARRHGEERELPGVVVRCRHEIQGLLPADRDLQPVARWLQGGRPAAGRVDSRLGLLRPGRVLPRQEEAGGLRRDVPDLRRQVRRLQQQQRVHRRRELVPVQHAKPPDERAVPESESTRRSAARSATTSAARRARRSRRRSRSSSRVRASELSNGEGPAYVAERHGHDSQVGVRNRIRSGRRGGDVRVAADGHAARAAGARLPRPSDPGLRTARLALPPDQLHPGRHGHP